MYLQRMEPLDADVAGTPLTEHLEAVYDTIIDGDLTLRGNTRQALRATERTEPVST